jgi:eukaryotic-like serine/threonine-protein kinase
LLRVIGAAAVLGVIWRLRRPEKPSPQALWWIDVGIFTLTRLRVMPNRPTCSGSRNCAAIFSSNCAATSIVTGKASAGIPNITDDGLWYYAMELLQGENLRDLVAREGPLPTARLVHLARQILRALGEAHAKGIIHRDIKPENVFVAQLGGESDVAKLLDFGIAKAMRDDVTLTSTGWITGTPAYMPPEVIQGRGADVRSDIYCVGITLYFAASGKLPFNDTTQIGLLAAHLNSQPPLLSLACEGPVPSLLEQIVQRCLAKNPDDRYPSTRALLEALAAIG